MSRLLTPRLLLRGFEFSVVASLIGFGITLLYGNNFKAFLAGIGRLHWAWLAVGVGLASLDWIGGGLRNWVVARMPGTRVGLQHIWTWRGVYASRP